MSKLSQFKELLRESGNLHLFQEYDGRLTGSITIGKLRQNLIVIFDMPEDNIYNVCTFLLGDISSEKVDDALHMVNKFNTKIRSGAYYILSGQFKSDDASLVYRISYTALSEEFDPARFYTLFVYSLKDLEDGPHYIKCSPCQGQF